MKLEGYEIYKRGEQRFLCKESKYRQKVEHRGLIKFAQAGDWICYSVNKKNEPIGNPFIAQPEHFHEAFKRE